jgi:hypothetical protein
MTSWSQGSSFTTAPRLPFSIEPIVPVKISMSYQVLPPSQIIRRLTFLTSSLTTRLIQKFVQNINSFIVAWYINKSSSRMT